MVALGMKIVLSGNKEGPEGGGKVTGRKWEG